MSINAEETKRILSNLEFECRLRIQEYDNSSAEDHDGKCGVAWDGIVCWNATLPGTVAHVPCPAFIHDFDPSRYAKRLCTANETWYVNPSINKTWTNFSQCIKEPFDISSHAAHADNLKCLYTVGYSISLVSLIVAVIIMLYWKHLHCKSNTLHINLFLAFIMRASMAFMKDSLFVAGLGLPQDVQESEKGWQFIQNGPHWECRTLYVLFMYAISATQTWILMEGLYLFLLIHKTIATERLGVKPYVIVGWALPWMFLIPWIVVKSQFENTFCWNVQSNRAYFWIMEGPWASIIVINFIFFIDIIWVLVNRARNNQRHAGRSQYRKFGKFILVLIPLFGILYIVIYLAFPSEVRGDGYNVVYLYIEMFYNSFQGFLLALLFCFLNEDVHHELRKSWQRQKSRRLNHSTIKRSFARTSWNKGSSISSHSPLNDQRVKSDIALLQKQKSVEKNDYISKSPPLNGFNSIYTDTTRRSYNSHNDMFSPLTEQTLTYSQTENSLESTLR